MSKLEDIPKKVIFEVPEGYFDRLPGVVQSRISTHRPAARLAWAPSLRYAIPILVLLGVGIFWYQGTFQSAPLSIEEELGAIQPDQLAVYLDDRDLTTEDLVETVTWSPQDLNDLENSVYTALDVSNKELEKVIDEYDEP